MCKANGLYVMLSIEEMFLVPCFDDMILFASLEDKS